MLKTIIAVLAAMERIMINMQIMIVLEVINSACVGTVMQRNSSNI